jgi:hypothetical protein
MAKRKKQGTAQERVRAAAGMRAMQKHLKEAVRLAKAGACGRAAGAYSKGVYAAQTSLAYSLQGKMHRPRTQAHLKIVRHCPQIAFR